MKFILLINVKMPTMVGILTFISMINTKSERLKARNFFICQYFSFNEQLKFCAQLSWAWKKFYNLGTRSPEKSTYLNFFLISQPKHMLWVLKRTFSMSHWVSKHMCKILRQNILLIWIKKTKNWFSRPNYGLMQVKSIAECSPWGILQYFRPSLSYHLSLRSLFCLLLSGHTGSVFFPFFLSKIVIVIFCLVIFNGVLVVNIKGL